MKWDMQVQILCRWEACDEIRWVKIPEELSTILAYIVVYFSAEGAFFRIIEYFVAK